MLFLKVLVPKGFSEGHMGKGRWLLGLSHVCRRLNSYLSLSLSTPPADSKAWQHGATQPERCVFPFDITAGVREVILGTVTHLLLWAWRERDSGQGPHLSCLAGSAHTHVASSRCFMSSCVPLPPRPGAVRPMFMSCACFRKLLYSSLPE